MIFKKEAGTDYPPNMEQNLKLLEAVNTVIDALHVLGEADFPFNLSVSPETEYEEWFRALNLNCRRLAEKFEIARTLFFGPGLDWDEVHSELDWQLYDYKRSKKAEKPAEDSEVTP